MLSRSLLYQHWVPKPYRLHGCAPWRPCLCQIGWCFVELIQFLEIGDLTSNDRFVHALGTIAFKDMSAGTAIPLSADKFDHLVRLHVKLSRQLVWQIEPVSLAARLFEHVEDIVGYNLFHKRFE